MEKFVLDYRLIDVNYCKSNYVKSFELLSRLIINSPIYLNDTEKFQKETRLSLFLRSTIDIKTKHNNRIKRTYTNIFCISPFFSEIV